MAPDVVLHPGRVGPGVLAQRPADRLADEELAVGEVGLDAGGQQVEVDGLVGAELTDDGRAAQPHVRVGGPRNDRGADLLVMRPQDRSDAMRRERVDEVPPGAGDDQLAVELEGCRILIGEIVPMAGQRQSRVPLLAVCRVMPEGAHGGQPRLAVCEGMVAQHPHEDALGDRRRHAVVGHRRLHVRLHRGGLGRVGDLAQRPPHVLDQILVGRHRITVPRRSLLPRRRLLSGMRDSLGLGPPVIRACSRNGGSAYAWVNSVSPQ